MFLYIFKENISKKIAKLTNVCKIKYKISANATEGNKITFNVAGNVAGETSSDKNSMNESATISIINPPNIPFFCRAHYRDKNGKKQAFFFEKRVFLQKNPMQSTG